MKQAKSAPEVLARMERLEHSADFEAAHEEADSLLTDLILIMAERHNLDCEREAMSIINAYHKVNREFA